MSEIPTKMFNYQIFYEPRAFLKILQLILTVISFSLTATFKTSTKFNIDCQKTSREFTISIAYPFRIAQANTHIVLPLCPLTDEKVAKFRPYGNFAPAAEFFVFVGVISMMYAILLAAVYSITHFSKFYENERARKFDFMATLALAVAWLISSIAWTDGVQKMKFYTGGDGLFPELLECANKQCKEVYFGRFGMLIASLIGGFGNTGLWAANCWFTFKETEWFHKSSENLSDESNKTSQMPTVITTLTISNLHHGGLPNVAVPNATPTIRTSCEDDIKDPKHVIDQNRVSPNLV